MREKHSLMSKPSQADFFLWRLFQQLRRRQFLLGLDDYQALRTALRAGFGWSSQQALCDLCCSLWAKSPQEQETLVALFEQLVPRTLVLLEALDPTTDPKTTATGTTLPQDKSGLPDEQTAALATEVRPFKGLPPVPIPAQLSNRPLIFAPQFPLSYREVVQAWRRLRQPVREGAATELDIVATVARRSRVGVVTPPVLVPRRRNTARLLLLVDRQGSMAPFHRFSDEVCTAIMQAGRLKQAARYFFHDVPAEGADERVLEQLSGQMFPALDMILPEIEPLRTGYLYGTNDPDLLVPLPLDEVLKTSATGAAVVILSDAGAARSRYDLLRLLDTVAFLKALRSFTRRVVWLNPLPMPAWKRSTAAQIARHVPMFPLDRAGMYQAVNVLRGQPYPIEKPV